MYVLELKGLGISTHTTPKRKLFSIRRMFHVQGTLCSLQWLGSRPNRALRKLGHRHAGQPLEVVVTRTTEVGGTKAEVDRHRAAVSTFVLKEVCAMLGTELYMGATL